MSIEALRQVTETEQANKQSRAAAEAEARQLVLDAERNGTELLKQVRSDAAEQGKDLDVYKRQEYISVTMFKGFVSQLFFSCTGTSLSLIHIYRPLHQAFAGAGVLQLRELPQNVGHLGAAPAGQVVRCGDRKRVV